MRRNIWIILVFIIGLVLMAGTFGATAQEQVDFPATQLTSGGEAVEQQSENVELVGQIGGYNYASAVDGNIAYIGDGPSLAILDVSDPTQPAALGQSVILPDLVIGVALAGNFAYVANGDGGLRIIDVTDPAYPSEIGFHDTLGFAFNVAVVGEYAYMACSSNGFHIIDISDPSSPIVVGFYDTPGSAFGVAVSGDYAFIADYSKGLRIIDISDPAAPVEVGFYDTPGYSTDVALSGNYAYVADGNEGLRIIDISNPTSPSEVNFYDSPGKAIDVVVSEDYAYIADGEAGGLRLIDISNPPYFSEAGSYDTLADARGVAVSGNYAYVANGDTGLRIIDVSNPMIPYETGFYDTLGSAWEVAVSGYYAYAVSWRYGMFIIDISNPSAPRTIGTYDTPGSAQGVALSLDYAFIADGTDGGLRIIDISDPTSPNEVGYHETPGDAMDVALSGKYAYVAADHMGLYIIDVSDTTSPSTVSSYSSSNQAHAVAVYEDYAYVAETNGLRILDISDPYAPVEAGFYGTPDSAYSVAVSGNYAYVANSSEGLRIIEVSNPATPFEIGFFDTPGMAYDVAVTDYFAYIADDESGLRIVDISNPADPSEVGYYDTPSQAWGVAVSGSSAFVANGNGGLFIMQYISPDPIQADFNGSPVAGIAPMGVTFINLSTGDYDTCSWDFGDGGSSTSCSDPSHTYDGPGTYSVSLTISGTGGEDTETKVDYITVYAEAQAEFSGTPLTGTVPLYVSFTNLSSGDYDTCSWDFGDGGSSTSCSDPSHTYDDPGTYSVSLTISGAGGEDAETKLDYINVNEVAQADFSGSPVSGIAPLEVSFTNLSTGDFDTCRWYFGDGGLSTSCGNPSHTYDNPGKYTVSLTVCGDGGMDTENKINYITVYEPVLADFSGSPISGIAPLEVSFANLSNGDFDTCGWTFGDGSTSPSCSDPSHTYNDPGTYTVSLTVSGNGGEDIETKVDYIKVYEPVQADFSGSPVAGIAPLEVSFTNLSTGDFDTCSWDYGDGGSSLNCDDPSHTYDDPGMYTVSLTVSGYGGEDTEIKVDSIIVYEPVQADFSGSPVAGIAPLEVSFTNLSTGDYDTCSWAFGDGSTSPSCDDPSYTYDNPGTYTVSLTVSGHGGEDTETKVDNIMVYESVLADFSASPVSGTAPLIVSFTNLSSGDYVTCNWDFGDGGSRTSCGNPFHMYSDPGTYTVSLVVSGDGGEDTETKIDYITVYEPVQAAFSGSPVAGIAPLEVSFTNLSTGDYDTCSWDFGDGDLSLDCDDPSHIYDDPGTYSVSLTISGTGGEDTETKIDYITVYEPVQAAFSGSPVAGIAPLEVSLTNLSTGDYDTCSWDFGDGGSSLDCDDLSHTYDDPGTYSVSLTVSGDGGDDIETKVDYITVYGQVQADFSGSPTSGNAPLEVSFTNLSSGDYDTCSWDFGDGGSSTSCGNPTHTYNAPGMYTVTLTVSGSGGEDNETKVGYILVDIEYRCFIPLALKE